MSSEAANSPDPKLPDRSRRKSYMVRSTLQARLATMFMLFTGLGTAIGVVSAMLYPLMVTPFLFGMYCLYVAAMALALIVISIITSNHIAGPVYRLESTIDAILGDKHLDRVVRLREGDEFHDLAAKFTHLLQEWRLEAASDLAVAEHMQARLEALASDLEGLPDSPVRTHALQMVHECRAEIVEVHRMTYLPDPPAPEAGEMT